MTTSLSTYSLYNKPLSELPTQKILINTINAHSYNVAQYDSDFVLALKASDVLLPDGISVVWAMRWLTGQKLAKIAGADLFYYEMHRLNQIGGSCFFLGSAPHTLQKITERAAVEFPNVKVYSYSPPYKPFLLHRITMLW